MDKYDARRPYAAAANLTAVLDRVRSRNLPDEIDNDYFRIAGIGPAVFGRVREALLFLGLVDEDDRPTDILQAMAKAPEPDYRELLEKVIRSAYSDELDAVHPDKDAQDQIIDAFRKYEPRSQTVRMVMLFLGLCRAAGMEVLDAPRERKMAQRKSTTQNGATKPQPKRSRAPEPVTPAAQPTLFSVTEEDIAKLNDEEFNAVWTALGTVARVRARALVESSEERSEPNPADQAAVGENSETAGA